MENKYLEKIAKSSKDYSGITYDHKTETYKATPEAMTRINSKFDSEHRNNGAKALSVVGAVGAPLLGLAAGAKFKGLDGLKRVAKLSGAAGVAGGALGYGLGHLGNKQSHSTKLGNQARINKYVYSI